MCGMAQIRGEIFIRQPPEVVFDVAADERNEPRYNPKMTAVRPVSDPSIGRGTRFVATMRSGRRTFDMSTEFTEFERPTQARIVLDCRWDADCWCADLRAGGCGHEDRGRGPSSSRGS